MIKTPNNDIFGSGGPAPFFRDCAKEKDAATDLVNLYRESKSGEIQQQYTDDIAQANRSLAEKIAACGLARTAWSPFDFPPFFDYDGCVSTAQLNYDLWVRLWEIRWEERMNTLNTEIIARLLAIQKNYVQCCASLAGMGSCSHNSTHSPQ